VIELERHIEILLLRNDCVVVPDLGGFTASHVAAHFDEADRMFIPPSRTLGFNQKLNVNDSLLAQSYTETYDISYPEALKHIADEVNELKQQLNNEGQYTLNDIGTLFRNENGNISFTPCEAGLLTPELYSLSSFEISKLADNLKSASPDSLASAAALHPSTAETATDTAETETAPMETEPQAAVYNDFDKDERSIRIKLSVLRNAAAVIIAVIGFFLLSKPINNSNTAMQTSQMNYGLVANLINSSDADVVQPAKPCAANEVAATPATEQEVAEAKAEPKSNASNVTAKPFCLVLASHVTLRNADIFAKSLVKKGFSDTRVLTEKNRHTKVVFGHYENDNEAYNALNKLRGNEDFHEAWVYKMKE